MIVVGSQNVAAPLPISVMKFDMVCFLSESGASWRWVTPAVCPAAAAFLSRARLSPFCQVRSRCPLQSGSRHWHPKVSASTQPQLRSFDQSKGFKYLLYSYAKKEGTGPERIALQPVVPAWKFENAESIWELRIKLSFYLEFRRRDVKKQTEPSLCPQYRSHPKFYAWSILIVSSCTRVLDRGLGGLGSV